MENTDIIVLTAVLVVLFLVFIIATVREFGDMSKSTYVDKYKPGGPISDFSRLAGNLFSDENMNMKKRIILVDAMKNALEQMDKSDKEENDASKKSDIN